MKPEERELSEWLHKTLDDDTACQEMKVAIIKWFDTFEYRPIQDFSTLDLILDKAEKMDW
jgi:hypothetical protein